jgi:hypothetical protein
LNLFTTLGDYVIQIRAYQAESWAAAQLFQIAASLEPH